MDREKRKEQLKDNERFWASHSISQLSFSIHVTTGFSVGFLAYLFKGNLSFIDGFCPFVCSHESLCIYFLKLFLFISVLSNILAVITGFIAIISRLYDGRITRNIARVKHSYFESYGKELETLPRKGRKWKFRTLCPLLLKGPSLLKKEDLNKAQWDACKAQSNLNEFNNNRSIANDLGLSAWRNHRLQLIFFFISIGCFGLYRFFS